MSKTATISPCGTYRYALGRGIDGAHGTRWCLFIMLNPSTADHEQDDPTIRRCVGFAKSWDGAHVTVVNLFALRATDPAELLTHPEPQGPHNLATVREHLRLTAELGGYVIAAWGAHKASRQRGVGARAIIEAIIAHRDVWCLGKTQDGSPRHPLYVRADQPLVRWP